MCFRASSLWRSDSHIPFLHISIRTYFYSHIIQFVHNPIPGDLTVFSEAENHCRRLEPNAVRLQVKSQSPFPMSDTSMSHSPIQ